jgi:hypothetical protein
MFSEIARPVASSEALLMRLPVDKLSMVFCMVRWVLFSAFWLTIDEIFVLIVEDIWISQKWMLKVGAFNHPSFARSADIQIT